MADNQKEIAEEDLELLDDMDLEDMTWEDLAAAALAEEVERIEAASSRQGKDPPPPQIDPAFLKAYVES